MKYLLLTFVALLFVVPAYASEVTGTISTGVTTGVEGTVAASPTASPLPGSFTSAQNVTLTAAGSDSIRYIVDGASPTCSTGSVYGGNIDVDSSLTIRAVACYNGTASQVGTFAYAINITPPAPGGGGGGGGPLPPSTPAQSNGDINNDGDVDVTDFNAVVVAWGSTGSNLVADFNHDGVVDILDFNILVVNWTA